MILTFMFFFENLHTVLTFILKKKLKQLFKKLRYVKYAKMKIMLIISSISLNIFRYIQMSLRVMISMYYFSYTFGLIK